MSRIDEKRYYVTLGLNNLEEHNKCIVLTINLHSLFLRYILPFSALLCEEEHFNSFKEHQPICPLANLKGSGKGSYIETKDCM